MKTTIKEIKEHFKINGYKPRHEFKKLKETANILSNSYNIDAFKILLLVIENKPIAEAYTHSYGFHTSTGREIIREFEYTYNEIK